MPEKSCPVTYLRHERGVIPVSKSGTLFDAPIGYRDDSETLFKVLGYLPMHDPVVQGVSPTVSYEHCPTEGKDSVLPSM